MSLKIWCDAGSKGNPGYCYGSYLIVQPGTDFKQERSRIKLSDYATNNQAEYMILIKALEQLRHNQPDSDSLTVFTDSKLMSQQVSGHWKVRVPTIGELRDRLRELLDEYSSWTVNWVPRQEMVKRFGH